MPEGYRHLIGNERCQIHALKEDGESNAAGGSAATARAPNGGAKSRKSWPCSGVIGTSAP